MGHIRHFDSFHYNCARSGPGTGPGKNKKKTILEVRLRVRRPGAGNSTGTPTSLKKTPSQEKNTKEAPSESF